MTESLPFHRPHGMMATTASGPAVAARECQPVQDISGAFTYRFPAQPACENQKYRF